MKKAFMLAVLFMYFFVFVQPAFAEDIFYDLSVKKAVKSLQGKKKLLKVPFYMNGQKHKRVKKSFGIFKSNKRTNSFMKKAAEACNTAFLSAIISLQKRANKLGADGIVDIKSITKDRNFKSSSKFKCAAGAVVANVALSGRVVKFK